MGTNLKQRQTGYYWVCVKTLPDDKHWGIGKYYSDGKVWILCGNNGSYRDSDLLEINETPIQSPDADNTERGERPSIKDYFPESFGVMDILPIYESQPELFNYAKALDRYIDDIENPTPPTLLNELRENADKQAIEFAEWLIVNDVQEGEGLTSTYWMNYEPYTLQELLELFKQSKANKPAI